MVPALWGRFWELRTGAAVARACAPFPFRAEPRAAGGEKEDVGRGDSR